MDPSYKSHIHRTIKPLNARLSSLRKSVHPNVSVSNNKYCKLIITYISGIHTYEHYNKAALSYNINTSCFFKKTHQTPRLHLSPQEATTSKGGNLLRRHTRLLSNPGPPSTTCFVHNIQSLPNNNIRSIIYNSTSTIATIEQNHSYRLLI